MFNKLGKLLELLIAASLEEETGTKEDLPGKQFNTDKEISRFTS